MSPFSGVNPAVRPSSCPSAEANTITVSSTPPETASMVPSVLNAAFPTVVGTVIAGNLRLADARLVDADGGGDSRRRRVIVGHVGQQLPIGARSQHGGVRWVGGACRRPRHAENAGLEVVPPQTMITLDDHRMVAAWEHDPGVDGAPLWESMGVEEPGSVVNVDSRAARVRGVSARRNASTANSAAASRRVGRNATIRSINVSICASRRDAASAAAAASASRSWRGTAAVGRLPPNRRRARRPASLRRSPGGGGAGAPPV